MNIFFTIVALFSASALAQTVLQVGPTKISADEFRRRYESNLQSPNRLSPEEFVEELIRFEVGVQEAERQKVIEDPLVKERLRQVLYAGLLEKNLQKKVDHLQVTDKEMAAYYKRNPEIRLAHILIQIKSDARPLEKELARKKAIEVLAEAQRPGQNFDEVVKNYSDDLATKEYGGDIGFQTRVTILPQIYDVVLKMKTGEIRGPVETRFGFHILKRLEQRDYDLADKQQLRAALVEEKREKLFAAYFEKLKKSYKVNVNQEVLKSILR